MAGKGLPVGLPIEIAPYKRPNQAIAGICLKPVNTMLHGVFQISFAGLGWFKILTYHFRLLIFTQNFKSSKYDRF